MMTFHHCRQYVQRDAQLHTQNTLANTDYKQSLITTSIITLACFNADRKSKQILPAAVTHFKRL